MLTFPAITVAKTAGLCTQRRVFQKTDWNFFEGNMDQYIIS